MIIIIISEPAMKMDLIRESSNVPGSILGLESELERTYRSLMKDELRIWLLRTLSSNNICTREIYYFVVNQARLRTTNNRIDAATVHSAMSAKIKDLRRSASNLHRLKRTLEKELLAELDYKFFKQLHRLAKIRKKDKKRKRSSQKSVYTESGTL